MLLRALRVNWLSFRGLSVIGALVVAIPAVILLAVSPFSAQAETGGGKAKQADCFNPTFYVTPEEERLTLPAGRGGRPAAKRFLSLSGLDRYVAQFRRALCSAPSLRAAVVRARQAGAELWRVAVARAQGRLAIGTLDRYDDRPLYWANISMTKALHQWDPAFEVTSNDRNALVYIFNYAARGITSVDFPTGDGVTRVLVSGFDPFILEDLVLDGDPLEGDIRHSNPSGGSVLQLDGRKFKTPAGRVFVQAVMLPVNWTDFDESIVEDAFGPHLVLGRERASLIMTISQGSRGVMEVEEWAGNFRGGVPDNLLVRMWGPISRPSHWPQPPDSPEWIRTTLPYRDMISADTKPWPVVLDDGICEWPAGTFPDPTKVRCVPDPSPGSRANAGAGGSYLSNESMYRSNRLRIGAGAVGVAGGHLHISALVYPDNPAVLINAAFKTDRRATIDQTVDLVRAAGSARARRGE
jgi:hypothetical protein